MTRRIAAVVVVSLASLTLGAARTDTARADDASSAPPGAPGQTAPSGPAALSPEIARLAEEKPVIALVTMGVGALIWERHGHIALCVHDDAPRPDRCYNYGIGDFRHPLAMVWGFFRGTHSFWVGKLPVDDMLGIYEYADRTIWVQPLPLTQAQKKQMIDKLEFDILDANRYYAYDHFWDNCTTRVRDVIDSVTGGKLSSMREPVDDRTFRDLAREGFYGMRLPLVTTDIAMGRSTDRAPSYYERMFLPQYMREAVTRLWGIEPRVLYQRQGAPPLSDGPSGRVWFALVIALATSPAWIARLLGRWQRIGLGVAIVPYVLLGSVLTFLAVISPLSYVRWNEICLVWFPFDILALVLSAERRWRYARGRLAMLAAIAVLWLVGILHQPLAAPLLWPAIPLAVVGFWPERVSRQGATAKPSHSRAARRRAA
ncbi:MAG TPA: DUF4105 domain-containing protein [Kofleriaceae bacterium]